jgi:hypothetical protein
MNEEEFFALIAVEQPKDTPEFRLYYDERGRVVSYSGDKSGEGNYIVIDAKTFAEARHDILVVDGTIKTNVYKQLTHKMMPTGKGTSCHKEDLSVIVEDDGNSIKWELVSYEL